LSAAFGLEGRFEESETATRRAIEVYAACAFARCIPSRSDQPRKQNLGNDAMDAIRAAVAAGWSIGARMNRDADLAPLRDRNDFRRLVDETMDRAMPVDAFSR
jgi:hypothetical protein